MTPLRFRWLAVVALAFGTPGCALDYLVGNVEDEANDGGGSGGDVGTDEGGSTGGAQTGQNDGGGTGGGSGEGGGDDGSNIGGSGDGTAGMSDAFITALWVGAAVGEDRIKVFKHDPDNSRCTIVTLGSDNAGGNEPGIVAPPGWAVLSAVISDVIDDCDAVDDANAAGSVVSATAHEGTIAWGAGDVAAGNQCELDIDAEVTFDNAPAWVPPIDALVASGVEIAGGDNGAACPAS